MNKDNKQEQEMQKNDKEKEEVSKSSKGEHKQESKDLTLEEKLKEAEEKLLRSLAEIENQRRRFEKEVKDAFEFGSYNFAKESLAILDNLQRAKVAIENDEKFQGNKDLAKFLESIDIIEKDLVSIFEKNRITKLDTNNKKFDPNFHQAMSEIEDNDKDPGTILHEVQSGYMIGERLLRPALVSVSKKKTAKDKENEAKKIGK